MKGTYVVVLRLRGNKKIRVGKLGEIYFRRGYYAYVGSALRGIEARVRRHLRKKKKMRWHIDYLREEAEIMEVWYKEGMEREECIIAEHLTKHFPFIPDFGSSDCGCRSHLFYASSLKKFQVALHSIEMRKME